ncbi:MAG: anthranilate synthase component I family protein [Chitinophagaceae bacterium]
MKKISIKTNVKKMLADIYTPVGIYLRLRDRFRDTVLLESSDFHTTENSFSFICVNAIGGIEVKGSDQIEYKLPAQKPEKIFLKKGETVEEILTSFLNRFSVEKTDKPSYAQGLFGYTSFEAYQLFENTFKSHEKDAAIPLIRYRLYQYVIAINHFKDELYICENKCNGVESEIDALESLIKSKDVPVYPFSVTDGESSNMNDDDYKRMVQKGIQHCYRGDVFQIVLSRRFQQTFTGDEFNVYRALRSVNPSPYLFFFDYGDYKLMGSSPESQLIINNCTAIVHPIAGTFKRTGNDEQDKELAESLLKDEKENAEHVMLVDLARNDLSRACDNVQVNFFRQVQYYSHVIHLVSEVSGKLKETTSVFELLAKTFPAGTLSGAPKYKAMELIKNIETTPRGYYGGCIGFIGFDGSCNHAIMIRSFLSENNTLFYQAGAGIVASSKPETELQEVNNKLLALKKAVELAGLPRSL